MLVLKRDVDEGIMIGDDIRIVLIAIRGGGARIGVIAPDHVQVHRDEVYSAIHDKSPAQLPGGAFTRAQNRVTPLPGKVGRRSRFANDPPA